MFLYYETKGPCRLPFVLLIIFQRITLKPVYYSTFLCDIIFVLGGLLMVLVPLWWTGVPILPLMFLKLSLNPFV